MKEETKDAIWFAAIVSVLGAIGYVVIKSKEPSLFGPLALKKFPEK